MSVNATEAVTNNGLYQSPATTSKSDSEKETFLNQDGSTASGLVGSVTYDASGPMLVVGDKSVSLGHIQSISATAATTTPATTTPATTTPATTTPATDP